MIDGVLSFTTQIGKVSLAINSGSAHKTVTPIQRKLSKLGKYLIVLAIGLCAIVVGIGLAWHKDVRTTINIGLRYVKFHLLFFFFGKKR